MLSERPRNLIVGLTMLVALAVLMYGIVLLGKVPSFGALRPYEVTLLAPSANGVTPGSHVELNGVYVGSVSSVDLVTDAAGKLVARVVLLVDRKIKLPATAVAVLSKPQTVGNPYVSIDVTDVTGPELPQDGKGTLAAVAGEAGLIPKKVFDDLGALTTRLTVVADDLHVMLTYAPPEAVDAADPKDPNRVRENATTVIVRLNRTIKSLQDLLTDPQLQGNVRSAIQNIADASKQLKSTLQNIDGVVTRAGGTVDAIGTAATQATRTLDATQRDITRVSQKLVEMLDQVQKTTRQLTEGNGTTGRLINDPRLYDGLLDLSKSLKSTVDDLDFLINKWKDEGVNLRLK
jgi:phospholipid/cholesterol/gamma-HCH transport system substrate-binding protein